MPIPCRTFVRLQGMMEVHSELCACYRNVEDGQKGKQDGYILFLKFP